MSHDNTYHPNPYLNTLFGFLSVLLTSIDWVFAETFIEGFLKILVLGLTAFSLIRNLIKSNQKPNDHGKEINVDID